MTDHNIIADHSDMNEPDFLMLTGVEINIDAPNKTSVGGQSYHLNLIAKKPDNLWFPAKALHAYPLGEKYEDNMQCEEMVLQYHPDFVNHMIAKANEKGFLVMYNHPTWSCQTYPDYAPLKGLWGMELRNTESWLGGRNENNFRVFKDLLTLGNRVFPLGADDMHSRRALGQSWIMVGASDLHYDSVIEALEKGDFYMSCGPEITAMYMDGNVLKVTCSDAQRINLETHCRRSYVVFSEDTPLREAEFDLTDFFPKVEGDPIACVYVTVTAADGSYAATRAYSIKELLGNKQKA